MGHFRGKYLHDLLQEHTQLLHKSVRDLGGDILPRPVDDVVQDLVDTFRLEVPTLHADREVVAESGEVRGNPGVVRVVFAVPFDGQEGLFSVQPSSILMASFDGTVRKGELLITVQQANASKESIETELEMWVSRYEVALSQLRTDVRSFNDRLPATAADLVRTRRDQLLGARNVLASLAVPVRKREDAVIPVPVTRRVHVSRTAPTAGQSFTPEPEVSARDYEEILGSTRSMGLVMERTPGTFSGLAEEGIRDFFLALLNFGFRGDAMGEVFNGAGKTDILIRVQERNVFIAECKVWAGEQKFRDEAVDQLLGYLGWRDTKCAIHLFVHERSVSDVVDKADAVIRSHLCFKRDAPGAVGELERRYVLHWPGDDRRELTLTLQVFAVPTSRSSRSRRRAA